MLNPTQLDITRLHNITEHINNKTVSKLPNKGGVTTAYMYLMLGEVWTSTTSNNYVYVGKDPLNAFLDFIHLLAYDTSPEFIKELYSIPDHRVVTDNGLTFKFVTLDRVIDDLFWHSTSYASVFFDIEIYLLDNDQRNNLNKNVWGAGAELI